MIRVNYQKLADISFNNNEYLIAGLYYDSTLTKLQKKTKLYRQIKKKRDNLKDLILYESITKYNDSILALINMNNADRKEYFRLYIDELKRKLRIIKNLLKRILNMLEIIFLMKQDLYITIVKKN